MIGVASDSGAVRSITSTLPPAMPLKRSLRTVIDFLLPGLGYGQPIVERKRRRASGQPPQRKLPLD